MKARSARFKAPRWRAGRALKQPATPLLDLVRMNIEIMRQLDRLLKAMAISMGPDVAGWFARILRELGEAVRLLPM